MAVRGSAKPTKVKGRSSVQPKLIRRQAEWRYSALTEPFLGSNKLFKVEPVTFEDAEATRQNSLVLNWQFRTKLNRVNFVDNFVRATVDEGTSITRVGWKRQTIMVDQEVPVYDFFPLQTEEQLAAFRLPWINKLQILVVTMKTCQMKSKLLLSCTTKVVKPPTQFNLVCQLLRSKKSW